MRQPAWRPARARRWQRVGRRAWRSASGSGEADGQAVGSAPASGWRRGRRVGAPGGRDRAGGLDAADAAATRRRRQAGRPARRDHARRGRPEQPPAQPAGAAISGQGHSLRDSTGGNGRCAWRPSSCPGTARSAGSPARCSASRSARSGSSTAARRRQPGRAGSAPMPSASIAFRSPRRPSQARCRIEPVEDALELRLAGASAAGGARDDQHVPAGSTVGVERGAGPSAGGAGPGCGRPPRRPAGRSRCRTGFGRDRCGGSAARAERVSPAAALGLELRRSRPPSAASRGTPIGSRLAERGQAVSFLRPFARRAASTLPAALGLHARAEAVLLGAMPLLGLIGPLGHCGLRLPGTRRSGRSARDRSG